MVALVDARKAQLQTHIMNVFIIGSHSSNRPKKLFFVNLKAHPSCLSAILVYSAIRWSVNQDAVPDIAFPGQLAYSS
jgi:hypothetical protein